VSYAENDVAADGERSVQVGRPKLSLVDKAPLWTDMFHAVDSILNPWLLSTVLPHLRPETNKYTLDSKPHMKTKENKDRWRHM
jgi:hypothetical protein